MGVTHEVSKRRAWLASLFVLLSTLVSSHGCRQSFVSWLVRDVTLDTAHFSGGAHFGARSISLDPGGVDVIRWSATTNPSQAGDLGMNTTTGQLQAFDNGAVRAVGTPGSGVFGDGSDGASTLGSNTTLTRDMYYTNLVTNSHTLFPNGFRVFVSGTLTLSGTGLQAISCPAGSTTGTLLGGTQGGSAGSNGVGGAGTNQPATCVFPQSGPYGGGQAGAAGGANGGGAGGSFNGNTAVTGTLRSGPLAFVGYTIGLSGSTPTLFAMCGGTGGGGGGSSAAGTLGGVGGNGAGVAVISAAVITGASNINCVGGTGGNASGAANGGGGGGGGGGVVYVLYGDKSGWTGSCSVGGGGGGSGVGTGGTGTAGNAGTCIQIQQ